jgi:hypothetical protein
VSLASSLVLSRRLVRALDMALLAWIAVWVVVASLVTMEMRDLRELSDSLTFAGRSLQDAGDRLATLRDVPFVGEDLARVGGQLQEAGRRAISNGIATRSSIDSTSLLLGLAIAGIPTIPMAALYLAIRTSWARDVRAVRRWLGRSGDDPVFLEFLARRAVERLPYHVLRHATGDPWQDLRAGRFAPLAEVELRRLGLSRRPAGQADVSMPVEA